MKKSRKVFMFFVFVLPVIFLLSMSNIVIDDNYHGIFILKKKDSIGFEIKNDIYPDEIKRLVLSIDFEDLYEKFGLDFLTVEDYPKIKYIWDERNGRGVIKNYIDDKRKILFTFSRFKDDSGLVPKGLFVGGEHPHNLKNEVPDTLNDTGMAYFDGNRWYHIWCSANEGIAAGADFSFRIPPSLWEFQGSKILKDTTNELIIKSAHIVRFDNSKMNIDRYAIFKAGAPYFILIIRFKNTGNNDMKFIYVYGDEPWLGNYGSSAGDVGWVEDGLVLHEGAIDVNKYNFLGFYDYGNDVIGELPNFTGIANFIEWLDSESKPDLAYFSNRTAMYDINHKVPLQDMYNRNFSIEWGPKTLKPGDTLTISLAIGMVTDYSLGHPVKPVVVFNKNNFQLY